MRDAGLRSLDLRRILALGFAIVVALSAGDAFAYGALGYYTGAYAMKGESGCTGADGMGVNPTGGCTPGVDALIHSQAFVNGSRGAANYSQGIADLASASLVAKSIFPDGSANAPNGGANLTDTFTVMGALPADVTVTVSMIIDSEIAGDFGNLRADLGTANWEGTSYSYYFREPNCAIAGTSPCTTGNGLDHYVLSRTVTVNDANRVFRVDALLTVSGGGIPGTHSSDALALIDVSLPGGLSYTSASGVFATVPEPSESVLVMAGLVALGLRRRSASARAA